MTSSDAALQLSSSRLTGFILFGGIVVLFAFYGVYFAQTLVVLAPEEALLRAAAEGQGQAYAVLLAAWQGLAGESLLAARVLSLLTGVLAIVLAFRIAHRLTRDAVMAAFFILSFVLYPPLVAAFALATPHALFVLLALAVLDVLLPGAGDTSPSQRLNGLAAGVPAMLGVLLHPLGPVVMPLWVVFCGVVTSRRSSAVIALGFSLLAILAIMLTAPIIPSDPDVSGAGHTDIFKALVLPYAMVLVGTGLSAVAAFSKHVRDTIGLRQIVAVLLGPLLGAAIVLSSVATGLYDVGQLVTAAVYVFPFAFLAPWPLIVWVRHVMPQVKSFPAWIAFPVIMYSCFWVVLGPVDPAKFPYSHRQVAQPAGLLNR